MAFHFYAPVPRAQTFSATLRAYVRLFHRTAVKQGPSEQPQAKNESISQQVIGKPNGRSVDDPLWFPTHVSELDHFAHRVLSYGSELDADHPGFKDNSYRKRRKYFADIATKHRYGEKIPRIEYKNEELNTWKTVFTELKKCYYQYACKEYNEAFRLCEKYCGYDTCRIPQQQDISEFLKRRTGFSLRPVAGLLSSRDFLAGLAFRVFHCTQYIRHHSVPNYTPEPDACHELLGHVPLFADPDFAEFSQEFGLLSLGASDEIITQLGTLYWFTIEFGLCLEKGQKKAYGAGLLSSYGELQHALSDMPVVEDFDPDIVAKTEYPITSFQPKYFLVQSFEYARIQLMKWAQNSSKRSFQARFNPYTQTVELLDNIEALHSFARDLKRDFGKLEQAIEGVNQQC